MGVDPSYIFDAFAAHVLLQSDEDFAYAIKSREIQNLDPLTVALAVEYRNVANSYLPHHPSRRVDVSGLREPVRLMLVADKVQNRKDFELRLKGRGLCTNEDRLSDYFAQWLTALNISEAEYERLRQIIS